MPFFNIPSGGGGDGLPVLTGESAPNDSVGSNGQLFIDTLAGRLYVKAAGTWGAGIDVGGAADWSELTGKPVEFPPAAHGHAIADVAELQAALDAKQAAGSYASATHSHVAADITDLATSVVTSVNGQTGAVTITADTPASSWEEIVNKPTTFPPESHTHTAADITDFATAAALYGPVVSVNGQTGAVVIDAGASDWSEITNKPAAFPPESHTHQVADVQNLQAILDGKSDDSHSHAIADVNGLDTALSGKADVIHTHEISSVNGLQAALDAAGATSVIDGGDYVGTFVTPLPTIQITSQPTNQTVYAVSTATWSATEATTNQSNAGAWTIVSNGYGNVVFLTEQGLFYSFDGEAWYFNGQDWPTLAGNASYLLDRDAIIGGYANGKWVFVDQNNTTSLVSNRSQGTSYSLTPNNGFELPFNQNYSNQPRGGQRRIVFGNNLWLAAGTLQYTSIPYGSNQTYGFFHNKLQRSTDGVTWTKVSLPGGAFELIEALAFDSAQSRFVMACTFSSVSNSGYPQKHYRIYYSNDGIGWTAATVPELASGTTLFQWNIRTVAAWGGGKFVVKPNYNTSDVYVSSDGINWTKHTGPTFVANDLLYDGAFFVAIGDGIYATSADGITWTNRAVDAGNWWSAGLVGSKTIAKPDTNSPNSTLVIDRVIAESGGTATFSVSASISSGSLSYQWQRSLNAGATWSNISGATLSTLSFTATPADTGQRYRCQISADGVPSVTTDSVTLTVF